MLSHDEQFHNASSRNLIYISSLNHSINSHPLISIPGRSLIISRSFSPRPYPKPGSARSIAFKDAWICEDEADELATEQSRMTPFLE